MPTTLPSFTHRGAMKSVRSQPPLPPLLRPRRSAVPDFQGLDFPAESDSPLVSSDDESDYCVSNESNNCTDDEGEGYDSDPEYNNQVDELAYSVPLCSEGVDFPAVLDSLPVKEESDSSKDRSEDYVSNEDDNSTNDEDKDDVSNQRIVQNTDYDLELEHDKPMWESYFRQVYESKGFDIKDYPGPPPLPNFYPLPSYLRIRKKYRMLKGYAESALKRYHDDTGTNHVIEGILTVKRGGSRDYIYYLIFLAKTDDEERYYFQAMVIPDEEDNLDFLVVRKRVKRYWRRCYWM
ncbi:hypothetical protein MTR67_028695 [Solanum verrucosum]|uniref:Cystatin domain-containing protein n=1 Tax=Solanum verrucosum TaxID=315347 RepID=A0AAF0R9U6_SOLVR|nr:hypothetical protein MTR67_028695 [Solanum verrucosum]